jgi:hypothetical protein
MYGCCWKRLEMIPLASISPGLSKGTASRVKSRHLPFGNPGHIETLHVGIALGVRHLEAALDQMLVDQPRRRILRTNGQELT